MKNLNAINDLKVGQFVICNNDKNVSFSEGNKYEIIEIMNEGKFPCFVIVDDYGDDHHIEMNQITIFEDFIVQQNIKVGQNYKANDSDMIVKVILIIDDKIFKGEVIEKNDEPNTNYCDCPQGWEGEFEIIDFIIQE